MQQEQIGLLADSFSAPLTQCYRHGLIELWGNLHIKNSGFPVGSMVWAWQMGIFNNKVLVNYLQSV